MGTPLWSPVRAEVAGAADDGCRLRDEAPRDDPVVIAGRREDVLHDVGDHFVGKLGERFHGELSRSRVGAGEHHEGPPPVQRIREAGNGACRDLGGGATDRDVQRGVDLGRVAVVEQRQQATLGLGTEVGLVERDGECEVGILTARGWPVIGRSPARGRARRAPSSARRRVDRGSSVRSDHVLDVAGCGAITGPGDGPERQLHHVGAPVPDQTGQQLVVRRRRASRALRQGLARPSSGARVSRANPIVVIPSQGADVVAVLQHRHDDTDEGDRGDDEEVRRHRVAVERR